MESKTLKETKHFCIYDKEITEIHKIVVGNGDPEKSLCRQVAIMSERQGSILTTLVKIDNSLKGLDSKYDETITVANQAKNAVEKYKVEEGASDKALEKLKVEKRAIVAKWTQIGMWLVATIGVSLSAYFGFRSNEKIESSESNLKTEIRAQEGVSKVTRNAKGEKWIKYNEFGLSDSIKIR